VGVQGDSQKVTLMMTMFPLQDITSIMLTSPSSLSLYSAALKGRQPDVNNYSRRRQVNAAVSVHVSLPFSLSDARVLNDH
jgi:hypothetical protein